MVEKTKIKLALGKGVIKKAEKLDLQELDETTWLVQGSSGSEYEVTFDEDKKSFTCYKADGKKNLCQGWKFCKGGFDEKQCSHCIALILKSDKFELVVEE